MENNHQNVVQAPGVCEQAHLNGRFFSMIEQTGLLKVAKAAFAWELILSPRRAGAICPSGVSLSEAMALETTVADGLVVELGAGTGAVTQALLNRGIAPENIVAVEQSAHLAAFLRNRFPHVKVVQGDAAKLSELAACFPDKPIDCIVSSIPLVSLPAAARESVIEQIKYLAPGKRLIQFTYFWGDSYLTASGLKMLRSQMVYKNLPPARLMTFVV